MSIEEDLSRLTRYEALFELSNKINTADDIAQVGELLARRLKYVADVFSWRYFAVESESIGSSSSEKRVLIIDGYRGQATVAYILLEDLSKVESKLWAERKVSFLAGETLLEAKKSLPKQFQKNDIGQLFVCPHLGGGEIQGLFIFSKRRQPFNELDVKFITLAAQFFHEKAQRLAAESEVRKSEEKYRRIVETAGEGFLLMDRDLNITDVNEAYCRMVGYSRQALIGKPPFDLASHEYKQFLLLKRDELLSKEYKEFEGVVLAKDGRHVPILVHGNTLTDDQGAVIGNMAFVTDMTEQKKSLELAGEIQKSLLPQKNLRINGLDIAGRSIPCEEIGGDYFDYLLGEEYSNRPFSVVVGDITGHGVDAALLMTSARAFLRMRSAQPGSISQIINEMNHHLTRDVLDTGRFMTLLYMTIDTDNGHLRWVRAGHDPAIVYDPLQDKLEELKGAGLALGLDEKFAYEENLKTELTSGQIIAIGTDGIWEAFNRDGEMYGKERFHSIIRKNASAEAKDILNAIYSDLDSFRSGLKPEDDITLVVIKIA
jgi:PAS domain S-box-containing protein